MTGQPAASQLSQSLQKSYTQRACRASNALSDGVERRCKAKIGHPCLTIDPSPATDPLSRQS